MTCGGALSAVIFLLLVTLVPAQVSGAEIATPAEKRFGCRASKPIATGYVLHGSEALARPFIVERRGLDLLINGHLLAPGPEWPPHDLAVDVDPGDPPAGSSPFDPPKAGEDRRDGYWQRKARFITSHHAHPESGRLLAEAYRKSGAFTQVDFDPLKPNVIFVTDANGRRSRIGVHAISPQVRPAIGDDIVRQRDEMLDGYAEVLAAGGLIGWMLGGGGDWEFAAKDAELVKQAIVAGPDADAVVRTLTAAGLVKADDEELAKVLRDLVANGSFIAAYLRPAAVPMKHEARSAPPATPARDAAGASPTAAAPPADNHGGRAGPASSAAGQSSLILLIVLGAGAAIALLIFLLRK